jgi:hypothetical protein
MHVDAKRELPVNAIYVTAVVSFILAAINFGSDVGKPRQSCDFMYPSVLTIYLLSIQRHRFRLERSAHLLILHERPLHQAEAMEEAATTILSLEPWSVGSAIERHHLGFSHTSFCVQRKSSKGENCWQKWHC